MNASAVVLQRVLQRDRDCVAPVSRDYRAGILPVEELARNINVPIWVACAVSKLESVGDSASSCRLFGVEIGSRAVAVGLAGSA